MNPVKALEQHGQSVWLDFLARGFVVKGDLKRLIDNDGVKGVTSNPSIFEKAIGSSNEYDGAIAEALKNGESPTAELFEPLPVEGIPLVSRASAASSSAASIARSTNCSTTRSRKRTIPPRRSGLPR